MSEVLAVRGVCLPALPGPETSREVPLSVRVMTAVFDHSESRLADRLVLLVIADRSDDDGSGCWRGKASIARMARVSRTTVTEAIARLEQAGELVIDHRPGLTNEYRVVLPGVGQNPADPPLGGARIRPTGRPESGRGSATRPAAIHPDTSIDPENRESQKLESDEPDWHPESVIDDQSFKEKMTDARQKVAQGRRIG